MWLHTETSYKPDLWFVEVFYCEIFCSTPLILFMFLEVRIRVWFLFQVRCRRMVFTFIKIYVLLFVCKWALKMRWLYWYYALTITIWGPIFIPLCVVKKKSIVITYKIFAIRMPSMQLVDNFLRVFDCSIIQ